MQYLTASHTAKTQNATVLASHVEEVPLSFAGLVVEMYLCCHGGKAESAFPPRGLAAAESHHYCRAILPRRYEWRRATLTKLLVRLLRRAATAGHDSCLTITPGTIGNLRQRPCTCDALVVVAVNECMRKLC
jgi:hypothetical protein